MNATKMESEERRYARARRVARPSGAAVVAALLAVCGILSAAVPQPAAAQQMGAADMLEEAESRIYPDNFYMKSEIATNRPDRRNTTLVIESYFKDEVGTFMEILAPARSRGTRFLRKGDSLWMYNPKSRSRRAIRLSPRESFQGTVFSNNDVGDPDYTDDYTVSFARDETIEHPELGRVDCYVIDGEANAPTSPYGRIKMWVSKNDLMPVQMEYFAKSGLLFKRMTLLDIGQLAGRERPRKMRMESLEQEDAYSTVTIQEMEIRKDLSDRMFSQAALTR